MPPLLPLFILKAEASDSSESGSDHVTPQTLIPQRPQSTGSLGLQWLALSAMFLTSFSTSLPSSLLARHTGFLDVPQTGQNYTSGCLCLLLPLPRSLFPQILIWLQPSPPTRLLSIPILSMRPLLTCLKTASLTPRAPSSPLLYVSFSSHSISHHLVYYIMYEMTMLAVYCHLSNTSDPRKKRYFSLLYSMR